MRSEEEIRDKIDDISKTIEMLKESNWGIGTAKQEWEIEMLKWVLEDSEDDTTNNK